MRRFVPDQPNESGGAGAETAERGRDVPDPALFGACRRSDGCRLIVPDGWRWQTCTDERRNLFLQAKPAAGRKELREPKRAGRQPPPEQVGRTTQKTPRPERGEGGRGEETRKRRSPEPRRTPPHGRTPGRQANARAKTHERGKATAPTTPTPKARARGGAAIK